MASLSSLFLWSLAAFGAVEAAQWQGEIIKSGGATYKCKCYSDNSCWPKKKEWDSLNCTVDGRLQVTVPPGAPCHNTFDGMKTYNAAKCAEVTSKWTDESWTVDDPIANLWPYWTNSTCLPTTNPSDSCTRGFYPEYVIMATKKQHIKAGIDFARENNLRLVIRNTGHDFMGRSTGFGSLAINTHSFKDVQFIKKYTGPGGYTGSAVTVGAGIQGRELYKQAFAQKPPVAIVGGECPTVGFAGGYIQGGGHGPLATLHGMAADNVLSFELITAKGQYVTANAKENPDLFWAMKGGGPSTFAAVVSVTVKTFPEVPSAGVILNINSTHHTNDSTVFWNGFKAFHDLSNHYVDNGMFVYFELGPGPGRFHVQPFYGPNMNAKKINAVLKPLFDKLNAQKIPYSTVTKEFPTWFELYIDMFEDEPAGGAALVGGRIITREDVAANSNALVKAYQTSVMPTPDTLGFTVGHVVGPGYGVPKGDNAVNPVWRNASVFSITNVLMSGTESWDVKNQKQAVLTGITDKLFHDAAPNGGAYVNEGNLEEPDWQYEYWGDNYPKLLQLRKKWDPEGVFYARTTPGTENWSVIDYGRKLCLKQ